MQPIIKWSGSKRSQTEQISRYFPKEMDTYYEPFIGGGSVLYGVLKNKLCNQSVASDICKPLIDLWNKILSDSNTLMMVIIILIQGYQNIYIRIIIC